MNGAAQVAPFAFLRVAGNMQPTTNQGGRMLRSFTIALIALMPVAVYGTGLYRDYNGDAKSDLSWKNGPSGATALWLMNGTSTLSNAVILSDPNWTVTHTGDLSGDGKTDLVWRSGGGQTAAWLQNGLSTTSTATLMFDTNWSVQKVADLNGDGKADLVWIHASGALAAIWLMDGTTVLEARAFDVDPNWLPQ